MKETGKCWTVAEDGSLTVLVIDDQGKACTDLHADVRRELADWTRRPNRIVWLNFERSHDFFSKSADRREVNYTGSNGSESVVFEVRKTLVLLDLQAAEGAEVWDFSRNCLTALSTVDEQYGGKLLKYAKEQAYPGHIWIYSGQQQALVETLQIPGLAHVPAYTKEDKRFTMALKYATRDWPMTLEQVAHSDWRKLAASADDGINHWPDETRAGDTVGDQGAESVEKWAKSRMINQCSLFEILTGSGYAPLEGVRHWSVGYGLYPAVKWIASPQILA